MNCSASSSCLVFWWRRSCAKCVRIASSRPSTTGDGPLRPPEGAETRLFVNGEPTTASREDDSRLAQGLGRGRGTKATAVAGRAVCWRCRVYAGLPGGEFDLAM